MKSRDWIIMLVSLVISVGVFYKDVIGIFHSMSPLETMQSIMGFILHYLWVTILAWLFQLIPAFIRPWLKTFQWKQRSIRRGRQAGQWQSGPNAYWGRTPSLPKFSYKDLVMMSFMGRGQQEPPRLDISQFQEPSDDDDLDIQL